MGTIDRTETTVDPQAPVAASFSSPGPNLITPQVLKVSECLPACRHCKYRVWLRLSQTNNAA
jgi:hypothetical protein